MREDLNKVLCERERGGSSSKYREVRHSRIFEDIGDEGENLPRVESMTKRYNYRGRKSFSEHLNPLYGFIRKNAGRKWDDVYSEICQVFDKRSVINQHILIHLDQYVEKKVTIGMDKKLYVLREYAHKYEPVEESYCDYYVDPRDGILKANVNKRSSRQRYLQAQKEALEKRHASWRWINKFTELEKQDGIWYELKYAYRGDQYRKSCDGVDSEGDVRYRFAFDFYDEHGRVVSTETTSIVPNVRVAHQTLMGKLEPRSLYTPTTDEKIVILRRQLSHKELKQYGVVND